MSKEFENLFGQYWDLAYLEGKSGVSQGDKANEVLSALRKLAEQPAQQEQEPCDMENLCIGCSPRNADGSCPGEKPNGACDCYVKGFNDGMKELDQPAQRKPLPLWTEAQHERAYRNSPELHKDVKSLAAFKRVAKEIAAMYGIKEQP